jgi:ubiquinone/menaquinone biosynthesis C-methylase UbiE
MNQSDLWYSGGDIAQNLGENYERYLVPTIFGPWAIDLVSLATPQPGERILDVACGTGAIAREASRVIGADGAVTGLDLNAGMLNIARGHDPQGAVQWREGSVQTMPFPNEVFSLVLCQQGLQYFPDRAASLQEMLRVLIPGGRLVLSIWRAIERSPGFLALSQALAKHISPEAGVLPPFALGDANGVATEVSAAGFHDVTTQTISRILRYSSLEEFVRTYLISTPLASLVPKIDEAKRTALLADMSLALRSYIDNDTNDLAFPIESQIIMARK